MKFFLWFSSLALVVMSVQGQAPSVTPIKCERPNEVFQCGSACQNECATLGKPCPIVNKRCNNGCYCISGYARDSSGICIPERNCVLQTHL
ncbi:hypothetical protein ILUMI_10538 [Ignelater luminosus]|uniref:TIL domain-containing protein n=1 Tax=Ignelater luminosus TaxID=2038154 RepID=A0A8K0D280_IGNLU|nr:hypothetical protein ILUMI_10538 [Ignelater luminosus]